MALRGYCSRISMVCYLKIVNTHWKPRVNHLTHLSRSVSLHGQKDSFFTHFCMSHFVRVLTHYGSNESNDSLMFFCALSWKILNASYSKLSKEVKNSIKNLSRQNSSWVLDQNNFCLKTIFCLFWSTTMTTWKSLGLLKFQCHFWVPLTICFKMHHMVFFKKMLIISRSSTKHANILLGVQYPLKDSCFCLFIWLLLGMC